MTGLNNPISCTEIKICFVFCSQFLCLRFVIRFANFLIKFALENRNKRATYSNKTANKNINHIVNSSSKEIIAKLFHGNIRDAENCVV